MSRGNLNDSAFIYYYLKAYCQIHTHRHILQDFQKQKKYYIVTALNLYMDVQGWIWEVMTSPIVLQWIQIEAWRMAL